MQAAGSKEAPTYRAMSIWMLTGTEKDGALLADLRPAMQSNPTLVIHMGLKKVAEIAATHVETGRGHTPAAVVYHALTS